jgi:hypothetical protein
MCSGWAILEALYRAGSRWEVGFDDADWWSRRVGCYPMGEEHGVEETVTLGLEAK